MFEKTGEALSGLWLAFDTRERLILTAVGYLVIVSLIGVVVDRAAARRERATDELTRRVTRTVLEEIHGGR